MEKSTIERAVDVAEDSNRMVRKYEEEILPLLFFIGYILGEEKKDLKKISPNEEINELLRGLYEKGKELAKQKMQTLKCKICGKEITKEENVKFCKYCGNKLGEEK
jgi:hypothetical protein